MEDGLPESNEGQLSRSGERQCGPGLAVDQEGRQPAGPADPRRCGCGRQRREGETRNR